LFTKTSEQKRKKEGIARWKKRPDRKKERICPVEKGGAFSIKGRRNRDGGPLQKGNLPVGGKFDSTGKRKKGFLPARKGESGPIMRKRENRYDGGTELGDKGGDQTEGTLAKEQRN